MNNFDEIRFYLKDRNQEIDDMILLCQKSKVRESVLIKAAIILLAYNTVEGCFAKVNKEIFSFIEDNSIPIDKLNVELQNVYYRYYKNTIIDIGKLKKFYENKQITHVAYEEICDKVTLFSGHLDARSMRDFAKKQIEVSNITTKHGQKILIVKNLRNKLAHGEVTFQDTVKDKTIEEIDVICKDCIKFLDIVIKSYENFYNDKMKILI